MPNIKSRIETLDWCSLEDQLEENGYALSEPVLSARECVELITTYGNDDAFRSTVIMQRHNFGRGEYRYFRAPLPKIVADLRESFYGPLAAIANRWAARTKQQNLFPATLKEFLDRCHRHGQSQPTPLMLHYEVADYNCLHQDVYGEIGFPLQAACVLNSHDIDYTGGEFLLNELRPRAQTRGEAITIDRGRFIIFPNRIRPVKGTRGDYRVSMRHGVSRVRSGRRYALGIIFHDAK